MTDIVERLRGLRFVHVPVASQLMEEAARDIERLRLTDAEREAISEVVDCLTESGTALASPTTTRNTLAALLARLA